MRGRPHPRPSSGEKGERRPSNVDYPEDRRRSSPISSTATLPAALDFLTRAFGFKEEMRHATPSGGVHGEASFQGQLVMMGQGAQAIVA